MIVLAGLAATTLASGLIVPSALGGTISTANYAGTFGSDGTVSFEAKLRNGNVRSVLGDPGPPTTGMTMDIPVTCDEGDTTLSVVVASNLRVWAHRLLFTAGVIDPALDGKLRIRARFTDDYSAIAGHVRASRSFGESETNCDSGRLPWTASVDTGSGSEAASRASSSSIRSPHRRTPLRYVALGNSGASRR